MAIVLVTRLVMPPMTQSIDVDSVSTIACGG